MKLYLWLSCAFIFVTMAYSCNQPPNAPKNTEKKDTIRFASYNVSMFRQGIDSLARELSNPHSVQFQNVAAVIQIVQPDVLALMEFDYDETGRAIELFQKNYLNKSQGGMDAIEYPYSYQVPSNTGILSPVDINEDGEIRLPEDAFGFGRHPGQYAFALLSKFPIQTDSIRSFQKFLWRDMPNPLFPKREDGQFYYSPEVMELFRISSKNHIDIPLQIYEENVHVILAHPHAPSFDGPEDRNGRRNFDEIRLLKDYISNADYLKDDKGMEGGLRPGTNFVIMGDLNADPTQGNSYSGAINQLLDSPLVNPSVSYGEFLPKSKGSLQLQRSLGDSIYQKSNTSFYGLRIDYVLPSADLRVSGSGIFMPDSNETSYRYIENRAASDHLLVWVDLVMNTQ